jgi:AraC-like DNA-binding protein
MATGLELGVQLRGEWFHHGSRTGAHVYGPGTVHVISPSEEYDLRVAASRHETGLQVGFIVYPNEIPALAGGDRDVVFTRRPAIDRRLLELCRAYADANERGAPLPDEQIRAELLRWVGANIEAVEPDPLVRAKREIDRTYASPLYVEHFAAIAGVASPILFSRRFTRRFGMTPVTYRNKLRLNEAARLTWTRPDLRVAEIGALVGFDDERYFHRAFFAAHGTSPAQYGRRMLRRPNAIAISQPPPTGGP